MDASVEHVRALTDGLSAEEGSALIAEARAEARERVRAALVEAMTESLLDRVGRELQPDQRRADNGELAWYVYGIIGSKDLALPDGLEAVEPAQSITILSEGELAAIASQVSGSEFAEAELRAHLADMQWVQRVARAHETVLDEIAGRATVVPMRMCTVYRTEGGVREMLRRESAALSEALEHLDGKTEWGLKVFADASAAPAAAAGEAESEAAATGSGAAYMERKRRAQEDAEQAVARVEQACAGIHEALCAVAADALLAPPQRPEAHGRTGEMVLSGVYLVRHEDAGDFHERIDALSAQYGELGLELERTGPWPPYNFVPGTLGATW